jgi:Holliday junction resolvase RusA-like endonuclease
MIEITLDYPPSVNHLYEHGTDKKIKTKDALAWEEAALWDIKQQTHGKKIDKSSETIVIILARADKRRTDYDNPLKEINDVLKKAGLIEDDRQFDCAIVLMGLSETGKNHIRINLIPEEWEKLEIFKTLPRPTKKAKKK